MASFLGLDGLREHCFYVQQAKQFRIDRQFGVGFQVRGFYIALFHASALAVRRKYTKRRIPGASGASAKTKKQ
jgi:hypothetical protein